MKRILLLSLAVVLILGMAGTGTFTLFSDTEASVGNTFTAWASLLCRQTTQEDFELGVLDDVTVIASESPPEGNGDVILDYTPGESHTVTYSPSTSTGGWSDPAGAHANGADYAYITSDTPSASETYGTYNIDLAGSTITQVRVGYDAWSAGAGSQMYEHYEPPYNANASFVNVNQVAQTFSSNVSFAITGVEVILFRVTGYYGTVTAGIYATTGSPACPTGSPLITGTIDASSIPNEPNANTTPAGLGWLTITFIEPYPILDADTTYALVLSATPGQNAGKTVHWVYDNTGSYTNGMYGRTTTGSWSPSDMNASYDFMFRTLGYKYNDQIRVDVSWDGGTSWSTKDVQTLTADETTYWYDVTGATGWSPTKLNNSNLRVRVDAYAVEEAEEIMLDWLPVEVTYNTMVYVTPGSIASQVCDTTISGATWDLLSWDATVYSGTTITFEVRASDTLFNKDDNETVLEWMDVVGTSPVTAGLPDWQYKQWRATLTTTDPNVTPILHEVRVWYDP